MKTLTARERKTASLSLRVTSWQNLFRVIRHSDTRLTPDTSNFWATVQWLEQQLDEGIMGPPEPESTDGDTP